MRLIDADALRKYFFRPYSNEEYYSNIDVEEIIDAQPTVESNRWIPCSEKLPESYKDVLVYYEYYKYCEYGSVCFQTYGIGYCSNDGTWHGDVSGLNARCLAWMPLPDAFEVDE